ncbi:MAG: hypothetical protein CM15mP46_5450 [Alphaproteobacteria bacterium]|nr:MAG: hypothetical protein CM15mP46_5450 [Alphaproteobacteria bacterium]
MRRRSAPLWQLHRIYLKVKNEEAYANVFTTHYRMRNVGGTATAYRTML